MYLLQTYGLNESPRRRPAGRTGCRSATPETRCTKQRHLLVAVQQPALGAVAQGLLAHRAGVDRRTADRKSCQPLLVRPLVGAEDALVLAGEGVAVVVLQQAAGADDDRRLPEVVEHLGELLDDVVGKVAHEDAPAGLFDAVEERARIALLLPQPPAAVLAPGTCRTRRSR